MKKVAIYICGEVSKRCTANGCLRAFNEVEDSFSIYEEEGCKLVAVNTCNGCDKNPLENLNVKIEKLQRAHVDTIHLSSCLRSRCNHYEDYVNEFAKHFNVIGYTHGSREGKKNNNINKSCVNTKNK